MIEKNQNNDPTVRKESVNEELASLNAALQQNETQAFSRSVEAAIEDDAKRQREAKTPDSGSVQKT